METKPPVTLALMAVNLILFFAPEALPRELVPTVWECCLQPRQILEHGQWWRLVLSAFLHADEMHVYYNMSSLLWKGVQLEARYGHVRFAALVGELLLLSHGLTVLLAAWLASSIREYRYLYRDTCAVGFSAVLFALKVVLNHNAPGFSNVMGIPLPTKYLAWAELFLASYFNPNASFLGHLGGILAGMLHVHALGPMLAAAGRALGAGGGGVGGYGGGGLAGGRYFRSGGVLGGGGGAPRQAAAAGGGAAAATATAPASRGTAAGWRPGPASTAGASQPGLGASRSGAAGAGAGVEREPPSQAERGGAAASAQAAVGRFAQQEARAEGGAAEGRQDAPAATRAVTMEELRQRRLKRFGAGGNGGGRGRGGR